MFPGLPLIGLLSFSSSTETILISFHPNIGEGGGKYSSPAWSLEFALLKVTTPSLEMGVLQESEESR